MGNRGEGVPSRALSLIASLGLLLTLSVASPAFADDYPSWDDVQNARQNQAAAQAEADKIEGYLVALENKAAELGRAAQAKGEQYNVARELLDAASTKADRLQSQATDAAAQAETSSRRAGQLIAQFARTGGSSLTLSLLLSNDSDDLLGSLGTMSHLTAQSTEIYERAEHDKNVAESLTAEAETAVAARQALAASAQKALDAANAASTDMLAQVAAQQAAADQLYEQLATLKGTTAAVEREYLAGVTNPPTTPTPPTAPGTPSNPGTPTSPPTTPPTTPPDFAPAELLGGRDRDLVRLRPARRLLRVRRLGSRQLGLLRPHEGGVRGRRRVHRRARVDEPVQLPREPRQARAGEPAAARRLGVLLRRRRGVDVPHGALHRRRPDDRGAVRGRAGEGVEPAVLRPHVLRGAPDGLSRAR